MGTVHPNPAATRAVTVALVAIVALTLVGAGARLSTWHDAAESQPTRPVALQPAAVAVEDVVATSPPVVADVSAVEAAAGAPAPEANGAAPPETAGSSAARAPGPPVPAAPLAPPAAPQSPAAPAVPTAPLPDVPLVGGSTTTVLSPVTGALDSLVTGLGNVLVATTGTVSSTLGSLFGR